jgi:hypothetical protein
LQTGSSWEQSSHGYTIGSQRANQEQKKDRST